LTEITAAGLEVFQVTGADVNRAGDLSQLHGLLSNDALVVAIMEAHGLSHLASNDADFDRVPGITRYAPA
jgi:predicted nucleic acid-binding protein